MRYRLALILVLPLVTTLAGCQSAAAPTPQIIYVTPAPQPAPTPIVIYITPAPAPSAVTREITGTLTLLGTSNMDVTATSAGVICHGIGGFSDVQEHMTVTVRDQAGTIVATGEMTPDLKGRCIFSFALPDVPDVPFYSIEAGHRGALTYSRAELAARNWHVDFTLGT